MEVSVTFRNQKYTYKNIGSFFTWVDERNLAVPLLIHTHLREMALAEGADISFFLSAPKPPRTEDLTQPLQRSSKVAQKKKNLGFNPFITEEG